MTYTEILRRLSGLGLFNKTETVRIGRLIDRGEASAVAYTAHEIARRLVEENRLDLIAGDTKRPGGPMVIADHTTGERIGLPVLFSASNNAVSLPIDPMLGAPPQFSDTEMLRLFNDQSSRLLSSVQQSADVRAVVKGVLELIRKMLGVSVAFCFTRSLPVPYGFDCGLYFLKERANRLPSPDQAPYNPDAWESWVTQSAKQITNLLYIADLDLVPAEKRPFPEGSCLLLPLRELNPAWDAVLVAYQPEPHSFDTERLARLRLFASHFRRQLTYAVLLQTVISHDGLTKVHNRGYFEEQLERMLADSTRHKQSFALLLADIDDFKQFNTRYGYDAGDQVLKAVANTLKNTLRRSDCLARYGGEEFAILLAPSVSADETRQISERLREAVKKMDLALPTLGDGEARSGVTISIGGALYPPEGMSRHQLWLSTNRQLLAAKREGKDQVRLVTDHRGSEVAKPDELNLADTIQRQVRAITPLASPLPSRRDIE